jgi:hypothetical protein
MPVKLALSGGVARCAIKNEPPIVVTSSVNGCFIVEPVCKS